MDHQIILSPDIALFHEKNNDLFELILSKEKEIYLKNLATSVKDFPIKSFKKSNK